MVELHIPIWKEASDGGAAESNATAYKVAAAESNVAASNVADSIYRLPRFVWGPNPSCCCPAAFAAACRRLDFVINLSKNGYNNDIDLNIYIYTYLNIHTYIHI